MAHVRYFERAMVSINILERRKSDFLAQDWLLDSGAFSRITTGRGHMPARMYVDHIERWNRCWNLLAAVSQDWMCESFVLEQTGLTVYDHQRMTVDRYGELRRMLDPEIHLMPVLQGYQPQEYVDHIRQYGELLPEGIWVGVGSVCKRNASVHSIEAVLDAIMAVRPDLRLHGFGLKVTALKSHRVNESLYSCDSMAWSFAARRRGGGQNDPMEAHRYAERVATQSIQLDMFA